MEEPETTVADLVKYPPKEKTKQLPFRMPWGTYRKLRFLAAFYEVSISVFLCNIIEEVYEINHDSIVQRITSLKPQGGKIDG